MTSQLPSIPENLWFYESVLGKKMKGCLVMSDSSVLKEQRTYSLSQSCVEDHRIMNYNSTTLWQERKGISQTNCTGRDYRLKAPIFMTSNQPALKTITSAKGCPIHLGEKIIDVSPKEAGEWNSGQDSVSESFSFYGYGYDKELKRQQKPSSVNLWLSRKKPIMMEFKCYPVLFHLPSTGGCPAGEMRSFPSEWLAKLAHIHSSSHLMF